MQNVCQQEKVDGSRQIENTGFANDAYQPPGAKGGANIFRNFLTLTFNSDIWLMMNRTVGAASLLSNCSA